MKKLLLTISILLSFNTMATSVCIIIYKGGGTSMSCDGESFKELNFNTGKTLSGALKIMLTKNYRVTSVTATSKEVVYSLVK